MKILWTTLHVADLDRSIKFYSEMAELKVLNRFKAGPSIEIAFMGNGGEGEALLELINDSVDSAQVNTVSIGFEAESVDAIMCKFADSGIKIHYGPVEVPGGSYFLAKDPDGFTVQFFQKK